MSELAEKVRKVIHSNGNNKIYEMVVELCKMMDPDLAELVSTRKNEFEDMVIELYLDHYTEDEINFMLERVESEIGKSIAAKEEQLAEKSMNVSEKFIKGISAELPLFKLMKNNNSELVN